MLQSFVISVTPWMFCLLRWDASFCYMSFDPVDAAVVALRAERRDLGGPWLCVPGAGVGRCREVRRDVGGPWLCVPGAGMGCCREAGREWWYAGQSGPLSRYDPQYHAHATKRWQCGGREGGPDLDRPCPMSPIRAVSLAFLGLGRGSDLGREWWCFGQDGPP